MNSISRFLRNPVVRRTYLFLMMVLFAVLYVWQIGYSQDTTTTSAGQVAEGEHFVPFSLFSDPKYTPMEIIALLSVLGIAVAGLLYALLLVRQVYRADSGTPRMKEIAAAVREGANAYLGAQFRRIGPLIILITVLLFATYTGSVDAFRWGRAIAFLIGALFSWTVGFVGMRLATTGNLRVAAAAMQGYGKAMQLGYRTGTVTGMLTDGLGLLGGTMIFLVFGDKAYEALLGFGFGGTLLALFMRVGGGIYTKAADVGADLVGKIEKDLPEDDPRNAARLLTTWETTLAIAQAWRLISSKAMK
jgi:K(+)-stimulated pyrophosphate-energized sodium pump